MGWAEFLVILGYACSGSLTPGPNNMMLLSSGVNFGFRRTIPHILGIIVGFQLLVLGTGLGLGALIVAQPILQWVLKIIGGGYMLYMAWKIAHSSDLHMDNEHPGEEGEPLSFMQAALFQWVNPKAWMVSVSALAIFIQPDAPYVSLMVALCAFFVASIIGTHVWAVFGVYVRRILSSPLRLKWFNYSMALLLAATIIWMLFLSA